MRQGIGWSAIALTGLVLLASPAGAPAATIKPNTTLDEFDLDNDKPTDCSLREAVQSANKNRNFGDCKRKGSGKADTIVLTDTAKSYTRSIGGEDNSNEGGDLDIRGRLTIKVKGGGGRATIDGGGLDRVLELRPGAKLSAARLTLSGGSVLPTLTDSSGGAILVGPDAQLDLARSLLSGNQTPGLNGIVGGGGVSAFGSVTLKRVAITSNVVTPNGDGGGIGVFDGGDLSMVDSSLAGNVARGGGGIYVSGFANDVTIKRSTITGNQATGEGIFQGGGGGILAANLGSRLRVTNVTVSGNQSDYRGGGIYYPSDVGPEVRPIVVNGATITANHADVDSDGGGDAHGGGIAAGPGAGEVRFKNSIVIGNFDDNPSDDDPDCYDVNDAAAHNLVAQGGGCNQLGSNVVSDTPLLGLLLDNGGPTLTHKLLAGSPAIGEAGNDAPATDQRGVTRDNNPDIGAYER